MNGKNTMSQGTQGRSQEPPESFQKSDAVSELTASIAHEINQPLTAISTYAQACMNLLKHSDVDRERLIAALDKLNRQSLRAGEIVDRIQRVLRQESDLRVLTSPSSILQDLMQFSAADSRLRDVDLRFETPPVMPEVRCDPIQVQQVIVNLIRNAVDAMSQINFSHGNIILVRSLEVGSTVQFEVVDAGTGVAPAEESLVFASFYTTRVRGMGVGLSICRSIIAQHGGNMNFRNNNDHGATFYFTLPVATVDKSRFDRPVGNTTETHRITSFGS